MNNGTRVLATWEIKEAGFLFRLFGRTHELWLTAAGDKARCIYRGTEKSCRLVGGFTR